MFAEVANEITTSLCDCATIEHKLHKSCTKDCMNACLRVLLKLHMRVCVCEVPVHDAHRLHFLLLIPVSMNRKLRERSDLVINILLRLPLCLETGNKREQKGERSDKRVHTKRQREWKRKRRDFYANCKQTVGNKK